MSIKEKDILELLENNIIDENTAFNIRKYNSKIKKNINGNNFFLMVVGIIGSILLGLGIILILSNNWSNMSKLVKTSISIFPLIIIQIVILFGTLKEKDNEIFKEMTGIILFCSVGASIALISRIYHIPGKLDNFFIVWFFLMIPYIYLHKVRMLCLLNGIILFLWYFNVNIWNKIEILKLAIYSLAILPFMYTIVKEDKKISASKIFYNMWFELLIIISLFFLQIENIVYWILMILLLKSIREYYMTQIPKGISIFSLSNFAIIVTTYMLTFGDFVKETKLDKLGKEDIKSLVLFNIILIIGILNRKKIDKEKILYYVIAGIIIITAFINEKYVTIILSNIIFIWLGIMQVKKGYNENNILRLNYGFLMLGLIIMTRFFDSFHDILSRGIMFILLGILMIGVNIFFSKKVKK